MYKLYTKAKTPAIAAAGGKKKKAKAGKNHINKAFRKSKCINCGIPGRKNATAPQIKPIKIDIRDQLFYLRFT